MRLKKVGFFRELQHGDDDGPSLEQARQALEPTVRAQIARYLRGGGVVAASSSVVGDWLDPTGEDQVSLSIQTDGNWVWPSDLAMYVEKHGVSIPVELRKHIELQRWIAPPLSEQRIMAVADEFLRGKT